MRGFIGKKFIMFCLAVGGLVATGCNHNLAIIHYSQPANAYLFDSDPTGTPHTTTSAGDGMFAFYCINKIENNDSNAQTFNFALSKVYAVAGDRNNSPNNTSFAFKVSTAPATLTVPAHTTSQPVGRIVINVSGLGDPKSFINTQFNLAYKSTGSDSVLLVRDDSANPKFLDPASPIHPNNLPTCP